MTLRSTPERDDRETVRMELHPGPGVFPWNPEVQGLPTPDLQRWLTKISDAQAEAPSSLKALAIRHLNAELARRGA